MKLYASPNEANVLLGAVTLLKTMTQSKEVEDTCDELIARINKCRELQRPDCCAHKEGNKHEHV